MMMPGKGNHVVVLRTMIGDDGQAIAGGESILRQIPLAVWASLVSDELVVEFRRNELGKFIAAAMRPFSTPGSDTEGHHDVLLPQSISTVRGRWIWRRAGVESRKPVC